MADVKKVAQQIAGVAAEVSRVIKGEAKAVENIVLTVLLGGHALIEGPPGTAKTLMVRALAHTIDSTFRRIQFTPDLMPSDIIGTNVYDMKGAASNCARDRCSRTCSWPTRSTGRPPRHRRPCSKQWRSVR